MMFIGNTKSKLMNVLLIGGTGVLSSAITTEAQKKDTILPG